MTRALDLINVPALRDDLAKAGYYHLAIYARLRFCISQCTQQLKLGSNTCISITIHSQNQQIT